MEAETGSAKAINTEPILTWKVHLLRDEPRKLLLILPVIAFSLLVCFSTFRSPLLMVIVLFLFCSSLADFLFPVRYEIDEQGASARTLFSRTYIEWSRVKKYYTDGLGIKLSPLNTQGRLTAFRGVYLRFGDRKDEVIEVVRRMRDVAVSNS